VADDPILGATVANIRRVEKYISALTHRLRSDLRVEDAYAAWCRAHGLIPGAVAYVVAPSQLIAIVTEFDRDFATLERLVRESLLPHYPPVPALAECVLKDFIARSRGEQIELEAEPVDDVPPGRAAKDGEQQLEAQRIEQDVDWFYRAKIKQPPDKIRQLARDYLAALGEAREGDGRSTVQAGIERVERALAVLSLDPFTFSSLPK